MAETIPKPESFQGILRGGLPSPLRPVVWWPSSWCSPNTSLAATSLWKTLACAARAGAEVLKTIWANYHNSYTWSDLGGLVVIVCPLNNQQTNQTFIKSWIQLKPLFSFLKAQKRGPKVCRISGKNEAQYAVRGSSETKKICCDLLGSFDLREEVEFLHLIYPIIFQPFPLTPPKTNVDTQNDGLEKVVPFKYGHFWYLC